MTTALDAFFETLYRLRPVDATFIGIHEHDHRVPDWSPAGHEASVAAWRSLQERLGPATLDAAVVSGRDWTRIDAALAASHVELTLAELGSTQFTRGNPSLVIGEAAFGVIALITREFSPAARRAAWLLPRLKAIPGFLAGATGTLAATPVPSAWKARAIREAGATERVLVEGIPLWCAAHAIPEDRTRAIVEAAQLAAGAVAGFAHALGTLRDDPAEARPAGEGLLALCIRSGHWIESSIEEMRREVVALLPEHQARLQQSVRATGASTLAEVQARLAARHPSASDYLSAFQRCWDACRASSEAHELVTWPDWPIRYVPIPPWTRMAAPSLYYLFYRSPAPFDTYPVNEYVVTPLDGLDEAATARTLAAWSDATIKLNHVVHHGALGHHVQNAAARHAPSRLGRVAATDCASRIAMLQGGTMAEGWACYATDLAEEVGFLTPDEQVSEQHTRVRMLARAIVDLEFHTGRRSFDDAVRLYVEEVGMPADAARAEAVKNSMFPGTALMYWFGTQGVHAIRRAVSQREGSAFTMRTFHDRFLSHGAIPVALIGRIMASSS